MKAFEEQIISELFNLRDEKYRDFISSLLPNVSKERIIGIRIPQLRKFAAKIKKDGRREEILSLKLPLFYHEMTLLYGMIISQEKDFDRTLELVERFLPHIDNWAACDLFSPKVLRQQPEKLIEMIRKWLLSERTYTVRFGLVQLMFFLDKGFDEEHLELAANVKNDEYYIQMAQAWFFCEALIRQYDKSLPYLTQYRLEKNVHNMTIKKACESLKLSDEQKEFIKQLKLK